MDTTIQLVIPGIPKPGGSKTAFARMGKNGKPFASVVDSSGQAGKDWRASVAHAAHEAMKGRPLIAGPVKFTAAFYMPRPKAHYRTGKKAHMLREDAPIYHIKKPDHTKLVRPVEDALTGIVWNDDTQVCVTGEGLKVYSDKPKAVLTIEILDPDEDGRHALALQALTQEIPS